ncbi:MAG: trypsin-like peptidase domain-containing protein [Clostridia bacterium]|nr:trypsin-like peptidase domain-containing protein [Clostridia bacterium]
MMDNQFNNNFSNRPDKESDTPIVIGGEAETESTEAPKAPSAQPSTYSYTAGNNPNINRDTPTSQGGVRTTYVPRVEPAPEKKKEKKGVPVAVFVICLVAGIVMSAVFGIVGVALGYSAVTDGDTVITDNVNGNGAIDAKPSDKVQVELPEGTVAAAAELAGDSVVEITTETLTTNFFYGQFVQSGAGSGVIIDADDGYIITCAHVVDGASTVTVTLKNGTKYEAELIGSDARTDIAVIQINGKDLVEAKLGNSDNLVVGQTAIAIGNPLGTLGGTVSSGIISALNREITIDGQGYSLLQIDTSINPGNSGGGLFDIEGNLIGVVNAKSGGDGSGTTIEGLGFAIPINQAIEVAKSLTDNGYVAGRVSLGIYVYEVNEGTNSAELYQSQYKDLLDYITDYGVYFLEYQKGQKGGFEFGDRIIAIDGVSVSDRSDIATLLEEYEVGDEVTVTVSRLNSDMNRSRIVTFDTTLVEMVPETE